MLASLMKMLGNPKVQKAIIIVVLVLLALWLLSRASSKAKGFIQGTFMGVQGDNVYAPISDERKVILEQMAEGVHGLIYGTDWGNELTPALGNLNALPDNELTYVAQYYGSFLSANSLYYDIDYEWLFTTDEDEKILARLSAMNLQNQTSLT